MAEGAVPLAALIVAVAAYLLSLRRSNDSARREYVETIEKRLDHLQLQLHGVEAQLADCKFDRDELIRRLVLLENGGSRD